jgi:hypothetical protein
VLVPRRGGPRGATIAITTEKALLGSGGSGRAAWELWIEPLDGNAGFAVHFP